MNLLRTLTLWSLILAFVACLGVIGLFFHYGQKLPEIDEEAVFQLPQTNRVYASRGTAIGDFGEVRLSLIRIDEIPTLIYNSFVAAEDGDFFRHEGVDYLGIFRAVVKNVLAMGVRQGASTITQQVVKNILLTPERTFERKIQEAILAYRLEDTLTKKEILHLYVNAIYFGNGAYGVKEAARTYFDKPLDKLSVSEAAYIAGLPKNPAGYALNRNPERAKTRRDYVLKRLRELDYISESRYYTEIDAPLVYNPPEDAANEAQYVENYAKALLTKLVGEEAMRRGGYAIHTALDESLQKAAEQSVRANLLRLDKLKGYRPLSLLPESERKSLREKVGRIAAILKKRGEEAIVAFSAEHKRQPLADTPEQQGPESAPRWHTLIRRMEERKLYYAFVTGYDEKAKQVQATTGAQEGVIEYADFKWALNKKRKAKTLFVKGRLIVVSLKKNKAENAGLSFTLSQVPKVQSALVAIEPYSRDVKALVGGFAANLSPFNRAVEAKRQPGSAFKPFVYLTALQSKHFTPATIIDDKPESYPSGGGKPWTPQNYGGKRYGELRLRKALAKSVNTIAVKLMKEVGVDAVIANAEAMGIQSKLNRNLSLALGAGEVTPLEIVNAYATLAAKGQADRPCIIRHITDSDGKRIYSHERKPSQALNEAEAAMMISLLTSVVQEGTAIRAKRLNRPIAGKTGTTNDNRDAWFVGFSPSLTAGVWVGYDKPKNMGRRFTGGFAALPAWLDFMKQALKNESVEPFFSSSKLVHAFIDETTGERVLGGEAGAMDEIFLPGTLPPWRKEPMESPVKQPAENE